MLFITEGAFNAIVSLIRWRDREAHTRARDHTNDITISCFLIPLHALDPRRCRHRETFIPPPASRCVSLWESHHHHHLPRAPTSSPWSEPAKISLIPSPFRLDICAVSGRWSG